MKSTFKDQDRGLIILGNRIREGQNTFLVRKITNAILRIYAAGVYTVFNQNCTPCLREIGLQNANVAILNNFDKVSFCMITIFEKYFS